MAAGGLLISMIYIIPSELSLSYTLLVPAVTCAGMVATDTWEGMAAVAGVAVMAVGVTSAGVKYEVTHGCFLHRDCGVI